MTPWLLSNWLPPWLAITRIQVLMKVDGGGNDRMRSHSAELDRRAWTLDCLSFWCRWLAMATVTSN